MIFGGLTVEAVIFMVLVWILVLGTVVISLKKITQKEKKNTKKNTQK